MDPFDLSGHLTWKHCWSPLEIDELTPDELVELHDDEHAAGFPRHVHDWEPA